MLKYIGELQQRNPAILMIPGGMATSPVVFAGIENMIPWQSAVIDWSRSEGPWDVVDIGKRLLQMIKELGLTQVILAGYSAGGMIAMQAAISDEDGVIAGLLLSNTGPCSVGHGDPDLPEKIKIQWFDNTIYQAFLKRCFAFPIEEQIKKRLVSYAEKIPMEVVYQAACSVRERDLRSQLSMIKCPVVVAHGTLDKTRTLEHVDMMKRAIPDIRVHLLYGGHTIMMEDRKHWVEILNEFIREVDEKIIGERRSYGQK